MAQLSVGVPRETFTGERRVALTPAVAADLAKAGIEVLVEFGAGEPAGFTDDAYSAAGAKVVRHRNEVFAADVVVRVRAVTGNIEAARQDLDRLRPDQAVIGLCDPLSHPEAVAVLATHKIALFAMDLIPRITRAQSMDVLSSQATVAGYKAVRLGRRRPAQDVPHADHGGGDRAAGPGVRHRRRRSRTAGDRHRQAARGGAGGLRRTA